MISFLGALAVASSEPSLGDCSYDREVELARGAVAFDQTEGQGWRPLYDAKCYIQAAELLREWQAVNGENLDSTDPRSRSLAQILVWHEAQMWAFGGRNDMALPMFSRAYREDASVPATAWNSYVDGTLAFLRRDRESLGRAIARLSAIPKPSGWDRAVGQDGQPITRPWPQNLDVLQGLSRCWDEPYSAAYLCRDIS